MYSERVSCDYKLDFASDDASTSLQVVLLFESPAGFYPFPS